MTGTTGELTTVVFNDVKREENIVLAFGSRTRHRILRDLKER
jgi:hypothetical protein